MPPGDDASLAALMKGFMSLEAKEGATGREKIKG